jgi:hypothetical protein
MQRFCAVILTMLSLFWFGIAPAKDESKLIKVINLGCNTKADEDEPHLAERGLTLYYASNAEGKFDIMVAKRRSKAVEWPKGKILEDYVSTVADDRGVYATDGKLPHYLFFATKKDKETNNFDIYVAVRHDHGKAWSAPTPINSIATPADELHPWLTANGKLLYFSRKTKEGWRVYVSKRPKGTGPGGWEKPTLVEDIPAGFHHATLMPNGKKMYLQGPLGKGRWGLFVSTLGDDGWKKPEPLDEINHPKGKTGDLSPNLSRDGAVLYFASDRPGGKGGLDIYAVQTKSLPQFEPGWRCALFRVRSPRRQGGAGYLCGSDKIAQERSLVIGHYLRGHP